MPTQQQVRAHNDAPPFPDVPSPTPEERAARLILAVLARFIPDRNTRYDFATSMYSALSPVADRRVKETFSKVFART